MHHFRLLLFFTIIATSLSCKEKDTKEHLPEEGVIEYTVTYSGSIEQMSISGFLPKKVTTVYNKKQHKIQVHGVLGIYELQLINPFSQTNASALLNLFDQKLYCVLSSESILQLGNIHQEIQFQTISDSTRRIAGMEAKLVKAIFKEFPDLNVRLFYFKNSVLDILRSHKFLNHGVLAAMEIQHKHFGVTLTAKKIKPRVVQEQEFQIPAEYRFVTIEEMADICMALVN